MKTKLELAWGQVITCNKPQPFDMNLHDPNIVLAIYGELLSRGVSDSIRINVWNEISAPIWRTIRTLRD